MKLEIVSVHNQANYSKEYVFLRANEDCDIGRYAVADSTYTEADSVSNKLRHFHWFQDKKIKRGEYVSLWTGKGTDTVTSTDSGVPVHRFYWGLETAVWNDDGDCAVLLEMSGWQFFRAKGD